jgi:hypothetical protein
MEVRFIEVSLMVEIFEKVDFRAYGWVVSTLDTQRLGKLGQSKREVNLLG